MKNVRSYRILGLALFLNFFWLNGLQAAALKSATVTEVKNDVFVAKAGGAERAAAAQDTVAGRDLLRTGKKSRAELEFPDHSIARLGANTIFSFDPQNRNMRVDRGTALIHVPPGQAGAKISTPAATASITGDVVAMRVDAKGMTQIVALSRDAAGPVTVRFDKTGETRTLEPGQLLTIDPMGTRMPEPVHVSVDVLMQSSGLAGGFKKGLPASARNEIKQAETLQQQEIRNGDLVVTGKLALKDDWVTITKLSTVEVATVQNLLTPVNGIFDTPTARFVGGGNSNQPSFPTFVTLTMDFQQNGSFNAVLNNPNCVAANFSGALNSDRSFAASSGSANINGFVAADSKTASGNFTDNMGGTGTFNLIKQ